MGNQDLYATSGMSSTSVASGQAQAHLLGQAWLSSVPLSLPPHTGDPHMTFHRICELCRHDDTGGGDAALCRDGPGGRGPRSAVPAAWLSGAAAARGRAVGAGRPRPLPCLPAAPRAQLPLPHGPQ